MNISQTYETTILDEEGRLGFRAVVVPPRSASIEVTDSANAEKSIRSIARILNVEEEVELFDATHLPRLRRHLEEGVSSERDRPL